MIGMMCDVCCDVVVRCDDIILPVHCIVYRIGAVTVSNVTVQVYVN